MVQDCTHQKCINSTYPDTRARKNTVQYRRAHIRAENIIHTSTTHNINTAVQDTCCWCTMVQSRRPWHQTKGGRDTKPWHQMKGGRDTRTKTGIYRHTVEQGKRAPLGGRRLAVPRSPPPPQALREPAAPLPHGPHFWRVVVRGTHRIIVKDEQGGNRKKNSKTQQ